MKTTTIGAIAELFDGPHATPTRTDSGPYFLNISSLNAGHLDLEQSDHVSDEDFEKWTRRVTPRPDDLLFSYETRLGEAALMPEAVQACLGRRMALLRFDRTQVDPRYFLYYYLGPEFRALIETHTIHGATVNRIPLKAMSQWEIQIPELDQQIAVADVLRALDDKIAANRKVAQIAEQLAVAHFADRSRTSETDGCLGDILTLEYGKALPSSIRVSGDFPVYGSGGISGSHCEPLIQGPAVIVGRKGTVGATYWSRGPVFPIDTTFYVTPARGEIPLEYCFYLLRSLDWSDYNSDSAVPGLNRSQALKRKISIPSDAEMKFFASLAASLLDIQHAAGVENKALSTLRDALLPRLMSGELRARDAENWLRKRSRRDRCCKLGARRPNCPSDCGAASLG